MSGTSHDAFVGRNREMARLRAAYASARRGEGRVLLLAGEAGIGKTRTAEEFKQLVRDAEVLVGRCYEGEGAPAFWPWVQILRAFVGSRDAETLVTDLGDAAADIAALVPELSTLLPDLPPPALFESPQARFRFFDGVTTLLRRAAAVRPVVLMIDDLHGADKPSLLLLHFLAREVRSARLLVVGSYRDVGLQADHPLAQTLAELVREQASEFLQLDGLTVGEVGELIARVAGGVPTSDTAVAVHDRTGGNPLYVSEVARALVGGTASAVPGHIAIPETVRVAIGRRLEGLTPQCRHVLASAGLFGREFRAAVLARASELTMAELLPIVDEACAERLIGETSEAGRWRFTHALVGEVLAQRVPVSRRVVLHCRIAEALAVDPVAEERATEIAAHWIAAGEGGVPEQAVAWARRAGDRATRLLAHEEAARLYQSALTAYGWGTADPALHAEILLALGEAHKRAGERDKAKDAFRRTIVLAREQGSSALFTPRSAGACSRGFLC